MVAFLPLSLVGSHPISFSEQDRCYVRYIFSVFIPSIMAMVETIQVFKKKEALMINKTLL